LVGNTLSVIDLAASTLAVTRTIDLGEYHRPHVAAFIQDGNKLVVTSETSQKLLIVDFLSGKVDTALATNAKVTLTFPSAATYRITGDEVSGVTTLARCSPRVRTPIS